MPEWYFKPLEPGGKIMESVQDAFFTQDSISESGVPLVREAIQNSLDATEAGVTRISFSLHRGLTAAQEAYWQDANIHYKALSRKLDRSVPSLDSERGYLVVEDFGASGLTGDVSQPFMPDGKNHFYHFFRSEGQTDKAGDKRGIWGVGKHVLFMTSGIFTVFGLTIRSEDRKRFLFGKTILKMHRVPEDQNKYYQDGYFGIHDQVERGFMLPTDLEEDIDEFSKVFELARKGETGLSLIVPYYDSGITFDRIVRAVIEEYSLPILKGTLVVEVSSASDQVELSKDNLINVAKSRPIEVPPSLLKILKHAAEVQKTDLIPLYPKESKWQDYAPPEDQLNKTKELFLSDRPVSIRIYRDIHKRDGTVSRGSFDVFVMRDDRSESTRPVFIRDGIRIPNVQTQSLTNGHCLLVCENPQMSEFLRTAENPAHTEWQGKRLAEKYARGYGQNLDFIRYAPSQLVRLLMQAEKSRDPNLLRDYFSIPDPGEGPNGDGEGVEPPPPPPPPPPAKPRPFRIEQFRNGFALLPNDGYPPLAKGRTLVVRAAYDTATGNPWKRYSKLDFSFKDIINAHAEQTNISMKHIEDNRLMFEILDDEWSFRLTGFDTNRQLIVRVTEKSSDGSAKTALD